MPSFIPKKAQAPKDWPAYVDLDELFESEKYQRSVSRAIAYLFQIYASHSDGSYERTGRPGVITEQFCLGMPTEAAYLTEIELVNAISAHALGNIDDENIKVYLQKYLDAHIFIYKEVKKTWVQEFKIGYSKRTGNEVPLFYVDTPVIEKRHVFNGIQVKLFLDLERQAGNNAQFSISKL
jgi:hypothetical protein